MRYAARMNMQSWTNAYGKLRIASGARSVATRQILTVMASKWRNLAKWLRKGKATDIPSFNRAYVMGSQTKRSVNRGLDR